MDTTKPVICIFNFPEAVFSTVRVDILTNDRQEMIMTHQKLVRHLQTDGNLRVISVPLEGVHTVVPDDHEDSTFPPKQISFTKFQNYYRNEYHRGEHINECVFERAVRSTYSRISREPVLRGNAPLVHGIPLVYFFPRLHRRCPPPPVVTAGANLPYNVLQYPHTDVNIVVVPQKFSDYLEITSQKLVLNNIFQFDTVSGKLNSDQPQTTDFQVCSFEEFFSEATGVKLQPESPFNFEKIVTNLAFYDRYKAKVGVGS